MGSSVPDLSAVQGWFVEGGGWRRAEREAGVVRRGGDGREVRSERGRRLNLVTSVVVNPCLQWNWEGNLLLLENGVQLVWETKEDGRGMAHLFFFFLKESLFLKKNTVFTKCYRNIPI
ncbi:hypothetical protein RJT34_31852 [Clitoria ternatea]|uniref:Uncharacterized protein n=1 Tax=Clitoria ternatea TaxID=43366 RepID=A0AAN9EVS3_CLITE